MKITKTLSILRWSLLAIGTLLTPLKATFGPVNRVSAPSEFPNTASPQVGTDSNCSAIAIWYGFDVFTATLEVSSAQLAFNGPWTAPTEIASYPNQFFNALPTIAVDSTGYGVGIWSTEEPTEEIFSIQGSTVQFGGTPWSVPQTVSAGNNVDGLTLVAITIVSENAIAFFEQVTSTGPNFISSSTLPKGSSWSFPIVDISASPPPSFGIGVDAQGNSVLVYQKEGSTGVFSTDLPYLAANWGPSVEIAATATGSVCSTDADVSVDNAGNAYAVWIAGSGTSCLVLSSTRPFGGTWTPFKIVTPNLQYTDTAINAVNILTGDSIVLFRTLVNGFFVLQSAFLQSGASSWTSPIPVSPLNQNNPNPASFGFDACGNVLATWLNPNGNLAEAAILPYLSNSWIFLGTISDPSQPLGVSPFISVSPCGYAVIVWSTQSNIIQSTEWTPPAPTITAMNPISGSSAGGTPITITGTGFCGISSVNFGGIPAMNFTMDSPTQITAVAPAGPVCSAVLVIVSTCAGASTGSAASQFTYSASPTITAVSPPFAPAGTSVTITGTNLSGVQSVQFNGVNASFTLNSINSITAVAPAGISGLVFVTVNGCEGQAIAEFTFPPLPPSNFIGCIKKNIFLDKTDYFLEASWTASQSPTTVAYNIYQGNTLVKTIPATCPLSFDKKLSKNKALGYSITAIDQFDQESIHVDLNVTK